MPLRNLPDYNSVTALFQFAVPAMMQGPTVGPLPLLAQSLQAWISFALALGSIALVLWRGGRLQGNLEARDKAQTLALSTLDEKIVGRLDGFGGRVQKIEEAQQRSEAREEEWIRSLERVLAANTSLVESVARANKAADDCNTDSRDYFVAIGVKIDNATHDMRESVDRLASEVRRDVDKLGDDVHEEGRKMGERMKAVETRLDYPRT